MKNLLLILCFSIALMIPLKLLAETYTCSHELSRFNRAGDVETLIFKRVGNYFLEKRFQSKNKIMSDTPSYLILYSYGNSYVTISLINKNTKEFGSTFYTMEESQKPVPTPNAYGKCLVTD
jgi:hypothetical protein